MSGISAIYILDNKKRILISREYRGDLNEGISEIFSKKLLD
jgi:AP-1 complex subunit mu